MPTERDWDIRLGIYESFVSRGKAPGALDIAQRHGLGVDQAIASLRRLHDAHAIVLKPGSDEILMAHPLSAVQTDYQVMIGGRELYANCAWDSLGIPAMLSQDARIKARHPLDGEIMPYAVADGKLIGGGGELVHFAKPFRQWYDDVIDT